MTNTKSPSDTHNEEIETDTFRELVAECAYLMAEKRNYTTAYETDDWLEAELEISQQFNNHHTLNRKVCMRIIF